MKSNEYIANIRRAISDLDSAIGVGAKLTSDEAREVRLIAEHLDIIERELNDECA